MILIKSIRLLFTWVCFRSILQGDSHSGKQESEEKKDIDIPQHQQPRVERSASLQPAQGIPECDCTGDLRVSRQQARQRRMSRQSSPLARL